MDLDIWDQLEEKSSAYNNICDLASLGVEELLYCIVVLRPW